MQEKQRESTALGGGSPGLQPLLTIFQIWAPPPRPPYRAPPHRLPDPGAGREVALALGGGSPGLQWRPRLPALLPPLPCCSSGRYLVASYGHGPA